MYQLLYPVRAAIFWMGGGKSGRPRLRNLSLTPSPKTVHTTEKYSRGLHTNFNVVKNGHREASIKKD
jgi:hypothetical protein